MDYDEGKLSNCCCAPIKWHDICTACGEHCESMEGEDDTETENS